jgi:FkbM family methyltransferase
MFNNCNSETNGEKRFYNQIKPHLDVIFDVGCRSDSEFNDFHGEVHYFDPVATFIEQLKSQPTHNRNAFFNSFGLGEERCEKYYYPQYQSFFNRTASCPIDDDANKRLLLVRPAQEYLAEHAAVQRIDFLKIDTEGYELSVLRGFGEDIRKVRVIQFEYGGTFIDNKVKLIDVVHYLTTKGFHNFAYLTPTGTCSITDFTDHYQYCNIVCTNKTCPFVPY